jgi:hypothetical protein
MINLILDSQIASALMTCPRLCDLRFNHHLVPIKGKSAAIEKGAMMHKMLEVYYKNDRNYNLAVLTGRKYIAGDPHDSTNYPGVANLTPEDIELVFDTFQLYCEYYRNDTWTTVNVEHVFQEEIYNDDDMRIIWKAKVDWYVDTELGMLSVDHKTMSRQSYTMSLGNQFTGQSVILKTNTVYVNKIGFQTSLKPKDRFQRVPIAYTDSRKIEWINTLAYYMKQYVHYNEQGFYPPNYSSCKGSYGPCEFHKVCETDIELRLSAIKRDFIEGEAWDVTND